ncbi:Ribonuclease UK114 [Trichuris trichiura]|uniref:Ribonuclease UK114 n=1 Tax=Trichuris trichiura TaxID=36087 RepID=A0A077Z8Z3_TRITR|nr:Ribonuclease UK114 [Trichuris trichiura]
MSPPVKKIIFTPEAPKPLGPYSQGVMIDGTLYISGQLGIDPETSNFVGGGADAQCRQALKNIGGILKAAGGNFEHVVKATVFLANMADWPAVNSVYAEFFPKNCPARSALQVGALPKNALVEIEAIAHL